jgi:DNA polymerase-1
LLLGADYSQIELRLLAHLSEDKTMVSSFLEGRDIHAQTAAEVMGIAIGDVTRNDRSIAKAVNFGLMYGQSSFGLSRTLKISRNQARDYIEKYFTRFHKVKSFLDSLKEEAEKNGHSTTMFGRKRFLPDINSTNRTIKSQAERVAVNSPIQGAAADLIKLAMRAIWDHLQQSNLKTKMILQVHDELIFEVPEKEVELISSLVKMKMENIAKLKVPLVVDVCVGENWFDLE